MKKYGYDPHFGVLRTLADSYGWSRHKVKSIRGQLINMDECEREKYLKKLIKRCSICGNNM